MRLRSATLGGANASAATVAMESVELELRDLRALGVYCAGSSGVALGGHASYLFLHRVWASL